MLEMMIKTKKFLIQWKVRFFYFQFFLLLASTSLLGAPFVDNGDGTITDIGNALIWQKCTSDLSGSNCLTGGTTQRNWANALAYCNGLSLTGRVWRLPSITELSSILDYSQVASPIIHPTYFPGTVSQYYWSSSTFRYNNGSIDAWTVNFSSGYKASNSKGLLLYVRCVASPP
nr:DUF1566 domain-containing protein [Leptospira adleri]